MRIRWNRTLVSLYRFQHPSSSNPVVKSLSVDQDKLHCHKCLKYQSHCFTFQKL